MFGGKGRGAAGGNMQRQPQVDFRAMFDAQNQQRQQRPQPDFRAMFNTQNQQQQPYQSYVERMGGMQGASDILKQGAPQMQRDPAQAMSNPYWQSRQAAPVDWRTKMKALADSLRNYQQQPQQPQQPQPTEKPIFFPYPEA